MIVDQLEDLLKPTRDVSNAKKVLLVGAEVSPFANVGGYARVLAYLSRALKKKGIDVRILMPKFGFIDENIYQTKMLIEGLEVPTDSEENPSLVCNIKVHFTEDDIPIYFLENREYYELRANVYGYQDDPVRWALLSRATLEFLRKSEWVPDIIHCNDWHTGHIPNYLHTKYKSDKVLSGIATIFTIHNLMMQGWYINQKRDQVSEMDFDDGHSEVAPFFSTRLKKQNFMRRGIMYADILTTVSKTYAKEMLSPDFGEGLDKLLIEVRGKLFGVLNAVDFEKFNPNRDKLIAQNYSYNSLSARLRNKTVLQEEFSLQQDRDIPLIGYVGRMEEQKGVDLIAEVMSHLLKDFEVQFVAIGGGDPKIVNRLAELHELFPHKVGVHLVPDFTLPRMLFAGSDMVLFPSRFEPCGIVQMEAMRYGSIPIVRRTGGLADTVKNYDPKDGEGWGFVFKDFDAWAFFAQIVRAVEIYRQKKIWQTLQIRSMKQDNSWDSRADEYMQLYEKTIEAHRLGITRYGQTESPL